nr:hypothetical protein [Theobroma cacao]DBA07206.1 TPA_exp: hypothetical protein [Theobroma cacao]
MTYRTTEASQTYQEVLQAVDSIQPPAVGFVAPSATISSALQTVIKQNNSIIQYLATIHSRLDDLESQISQVQQKASPRPASSQIEALTRQLSQLNLSAIEGIPKQTVRKAQGPYFVFKDPQRIFNDVAGIAKPSSNQSKGKAVATSSESKDETQQQQ